jgi:hemoglobin-like flavoprotein
MTTAEINLVKNSWKLLRDVKPEIIGDVFYTKLFLDSPGLRHMFTTSTQEQSRKLVSMLSVVIARLHQLDNLKEDIRQLGLRHKKYGVKAEHYDLVANALIWTLSTALGADWNDEIENAWVKCYTILASAMMQSTESSHAIVS